MIAVLFMIYLISLLMLIFGIHTPPGKKYLIFLYHGYIRIVSLLKFGEQNKK